MFNNQQQLQQLIQLQHLLQQQQHTVQQPTHHPQSAQHPLPVQHAAPRPMPNPVQHQQPQQMLNLRAANPARLLNTHPMIQRALLMQQMQGNLRGLNMVAPPPMPPFFTAAARHSILGIPPMGVTVKAPSMTFPHMPFQQPRVFHKDHYKNTDAKRDGDHSSSAPGKYTSDPNTERGNTDLPPTASEADDSLNSDNENLTEGSNTDPLEPSAKRARSSETGTDEAGFAEAGTTVDADDVAEERSVQSQSAKGISGGRALKVTIQVRSESRTTALQPACAEKGSTLSGPRFCCYICKTSYHSLQNFQSHLVTAQHHKKIQEIQHVSNACLVTLLPTAKDGLGDMGSRDDKKKQMRWCNVCQVHFSCDLIKHRRTQEHKMAKRSLRPFCTVCSRHFKTPRKFVEHMKSPEHKQKSQELRENETWSPEDSEELITVDAVGCFEEDEDDGDDDEEGINADDISEDTECLLEKGEDNISDYEEEYKADTAYGLDYMVPVAGHLCRLCHKFYPSDSAARLTHCKSLVHFQNVQRSKAEKKSCVALQDKLSVQEDESGSLGEVTTADKTDEGSVPLQQDGGVKAGSSPGARGGDTSVNSKCGDTEDSLSVFDAVIGSCEEDSGLLLDQEMFLDQREDKAEEEETLYSDETSSTCRPTSRRRVR